MIELVKQLKGATARDVRSDVMAGLTVAVMLIPQGMAYALLAGLPPIYGLYAGFIPLIVYPFFGSSRQMSVGPVALVSIIVLAGLSEMATPGSPEFIQLALLTALVAGIIQVLLAVFRMGFLINFLSEPVLNGFTAAAAIIIAVSQFKNILDVEVGNGRTLIAMVRDLAQNISQTNPLSLSLGLGGVIFILGLKKIKKSLPGALLAVIISTALVYFAGLNERGVEIVEQVPSGLPAFSFEFIQLDQALRVIPLALIICLISFIESLAIGKTIAARHENYRISPNKELFALGISKVVGAFFLAYPNTGSFTRSAINDDAGAKTGLSSIFAGLFVALSLVLLTSLFFYLPKAILAAIVVAACFGLLNVPYARRIFKLDRMDFLVYSTTFLLTLLLGVQQGVIAGIILSLVLILYTTSKPHFAVLGKLRGTNTYRNIKRYPDAVLEEDILVMRYDNDLYFANAEHFFDVVMNEVDKRNGIKYVVIDASGISMIDTTALHKLEILYDSLDENQIQLVLACTKGAVRDILNQSELQHKIGFENHYLTIQDAIDGIQKVVEKSDLSREYAAQHFKK